MTDTPTPALTADDYREDGIRGYHQRCRDKWGERAPDYCADCFLLSRLAVARHVRDTGCEELREAVRRLIDAIETTGLHEYDDGRGGVDLCIPISGIRGVMNDACEAAGHEFLHPEYAPPFCRWCGAVRASREEAPE